MPEIMIAPIGENSVIADTMQVYPCEEHVHVCMCHENGDVICEMLFTADVALDIAKRIEAAADTSLGVE